MLEHEKARARTPDMRQMRERWNGRDDAMLEQMYNAGEKLAKIATALRRTTPAVSARARKLDAQGRTLEPRKRHHAWEPQDKATAIAMATAQASAHDIGEALGRDSENVRRWLKERGLKAGPDTRGRPKGAGSHYGGSKPSKDHPSAGTGWTENEDQRLIESYRKGVAVKRIAADLGRATQSAHARLHALRAVGALGKARSRNRRWTRKEERAIAEGVEAGRTHEAIGKLIGRTSNAVRSRARRAGAQIRTVQATGITSKTGRPWTWSDDRTLLEMTVAKASTDRIGRTLGRSPNAVLNHRTKMKKRRESAQARRRKFVEQVAMREYARNVQL